MRQLSREGIFGIRLHLKSYWKGALPLGPKKLKGRLPENGIFISVAFHLWICKRVEIKMLEVVETWIRECGKVCKNCTAVPLFDQTLKCCISRSMGFCITQV